jgi:putative glycosyltransferase (TIGR04372 family)
MNRINLGALRWVRGRFARMRARSWSDRAGVTRRFMRTLLLATSVGAYKGLLVVIYLPAAIVLRMFNVRFPYSHTVGTKFGHLAGDPGCYFKAQATGILPPHRAILVVSRSRVSNRFLLELWRSKFTVVSHPVLAILLTPFKWSPLTRSQMYLYGYQIPSEQGDILTFGPAMDEIETRFEKINAGNPVLTIDEKVQNQGRRVLLQLGIPLGSWWVALHVRQGPSDDHSGFPRNADPRTYLDAAQAIFDRGGYVVRIGDPSMTPLPKMDGLVDLAHSSHRSDWMDIFVFGCARFLLSSNSGPVSLAQLFEVPVAAANWIPMSQGLVGRRDIRIPKLILRSSSLEILSFDTVLGSDALRDIDTVGSFNQASVEWQDNTPEEIEELAVEMLDRLEGTFENEPSDDKLQNRFQELVLSSITPLTHGTTAKIGQQFLRARSDLFEDNSLSLNEQSSPQNTRDT